MALTRVSELRNAMIAGVWSNSNYDDEKNTRERLLRSIDDFYDNAVAQLYGGEKEYVEEIDRENDPFFAAMKVPKLEVSKESLGELNSG